MRLLASVLDWLWRQPWLQPPLSRRRETRRSRLRHWKSCHLPRGLLSGLLHFGHWAVDPLVIGTAIKLVGLYPRGMRNALDFQVRRLEVHLPRLPPAFNGFRLLFASDLHLDGLPGLPERLRAILPSLEADLCLLGGDYRMDTWGSSQPALDLLLGLLPHMRARHGTVAVLGNHDCVELVTPLEAAGVRVLLNEAVALERQGQRLWLAGVDDPHYYRTHDVAAALAPVPAEECVIFLAHAPNVFQEAASRGADLYLCGHTHAGQIQLPWLGLLFTHTTAPRRCCQGFWHQEAMVGYTTSGLAPSGVPVRFHCPGEIVLLTLRRGTSTPLDIFTN